MTNKNKTPPIIVSACLAGIACRYDCKSKPNQEILDLIIKGDAIPLCPEQLGGLSTPRDPAEISGSKVISNKGIDVTAQYLRGAQEALQLAKLAGATQAIVKSISPMCGCGEIYDGSFTGKRINGDGIFTKLLKKNGFTVRSEKN